MDSEMRIRNAVEADLAAIVDIYNSTIACRSVTADLDPVSVDSRWDWFRSRTPDRRPLWVVESEDETRTDFPRIAGWLAFQDFYSARRAYDVTAELSIYISPDYRQQGIGRKLLHHAIANSPDLGIKNLVGCIFASNTASLRLFAGFGFEQWGYLPAVAEFESGTCDLVIMGRRVRQDPPEPTLPTPDRTAPRLNDVPSDHSSG